MAELSFDDVKSVVEEIAIEEGFKNYKLTVKEDEFTGGNYLSKIVRVHIEEDGGGKKPVNLLIKLSCTNEEGRQKLPAQEFYETEITAYKYVLPELDKFQCENDLPKDMRFKYAKFYRGGYDFMKEYVIMDDLSYSGYDLYGKDKPLDLEHATIILHNLANYHAASFAMREKQPERFSKIKSQVRDTFNYPDVVFSMITNVPSVVFPYITCEKRKKAIEDLLENRESVMRNCLDSSLTEPYNTICHGDLWNNNSLFNKQGGETECIFVDYQFMRYASPATDIMYNMCMSTERVFREKHFKELCDGYYMAFKTNLKHYNLDANRIYPRDVFHKHLKDVTPFGILFGFIATGLLHTKEGEEKKLEEWVDDKAKMSYTPTEAMISRMEGLVDEIIACTDNV